MYIFSALMYILWPTGFTAGIPKLELLPTDTNQNDVIFYLYTRENPLVPVQLNENLLNTVNPEKFTKVIIHGYFESPEKLCYMNLANEYLKKGDYNIIQVDWSKPASSTYIVSSQNAESVGIIVGQLLVNLHINSGLPLKNIHVIGHSLGAHIGGYAGKEVIKRTGIPLARITALDAAGPLFEEPLFIMEGLTKDDAQVVDAIHTDGGIFGRRNPTGTIDFYPNGGAAPQPGCSISLMSILLTNYFDIHQKVFCSHQKSCRYFVNSINNKTFQGVRCNTWNDFKKAKCSGNKIAIMGDNYAFSPSTSGLFFLRTNSSDLT